MNTQEIEKEKYLFPKQLPLMLDGAEIDLIRCPNLLITGNEDLSLQITDLCWQLIRHKDRRYHRLRLCDLVQNSFPNLSKQEKSIIQTSDSSSSTHVLHRALYNAKDYYKPLKAINARDIYDFNCHKEDEWETHIVSSIHPEYLGGLLEGSERELLLKIRREIVVIANLDAVLAADPKNIVKLLHIAMIGRITGVHVIAAVSNISMLPEHLLVHFSVKTTR